MKFLKSLFFVLIIFFFFDTCIAQTDSKTYDASKYFTYTNKAELQIVNSSYTAAILFYDSAFSNLPVPLSQDMYNYSICAVLEKEYLKAYNAIKFIIERGLDSIVIFKNPAFYDFKIQEQKRIRKDYPTFISNRSKYIDSAIIQQIFEMNNADQYFFRRLPNNLSNQAFKDSLQKNDDSLIIRLTKYFSLFQYLHEGIIGVRVENQKLSCYPIFNILIRHHYQNHKYDLTSILKKALESGYLKPELYASWLELEFQGTPGFGEEVLIKETKDSIYIAKFPGFRSKIEENRKKIGLCTLEEQVQKTIFSRYFDKNGFLFFSSIVIISDSNKSLIEVLRKFTDIIAKPIKK